MGIVNEEESSLLDKLVENLDIFIQRLLWATGEYGGRGLFEKRFFGPPDFSSIHCMYESTP